MSEQSIWNKLIESGFNEFAAAGIMGNMQAESAFKSNNVEDRSGIPDELYTQQVDSGIRSRAQFCSDSYGYGLCQWTPADRKGRLYDFAKQKGASIGDEEMQLEYFIYEIKSFYTYVYNPLMSAVSVKDASDVFLYKFEIPANAAAQSGTRANMGMAIYNKYHGSHSASNNSPVMPAVPTITIPGGTSTGPHIVKYGDKTWYGNAIQSLLNAHGYNIKVDKDVRDETMIALRNFAQQRNLDPEKDFIQVVYELFEE